MERVTTNAILTRDERIASALRAPNDTVQPREKGSFQSSANIIQRGNRLNVFTSQLLSRPRWILWQGVPRIRPSPAWPPVEPLKSPRQARLQSPDQSTPPRQRGGGEARMERYATVRESTSPHSPLEKILPLVPSTPSLPIFRRCLYGDSQRRTMYDERRMT